MIKDGKSKENSRKKRRQAGVGEEGFSGGHSGVDKARGDGALHAQRHEHQQREELRHADEPGGGPDGVHRDGV